MLKLLGRTSSINVRNALWVAAETGANFVHETGAAGVTQTIRV